MFPKDKTQVFVNENPAIRCFSFCCIQPATHFIGRPDGPRNLLLPLCEGCMESLIDSLYINSWERLIVRIEKIEEAKAQERDLASPQAGEYPCKICGEVFPTPQRLGNHVKRCRKEAEAVGAAAESGS